MKFHSKYKKVSPWWRFIRQEFKLLIPHVEYVGIHDIEYNDDFVSLTKDGMLMVKKGFLWGASGPTIDTKSSRRASLIHDALYHLSDMDVFKGKESRKMREISDNLLYKICLEDGMYKWRAKMWLETLEIFGGFAWESDK